jgi:hypothetical protein
MGLGLAEPSLLLIQSVWEWLGHPQPFFFFLNLLFYALGLVLFTLYPPKIIYVYHFISEIIFESLG